MTISLSNHSKEEKNILDYISQLWRGEVSLAKTYWVFYVLAWKKALRLAVQVEAEAHRQAEDDRVANELDFRLGARAFAASDPVTRQISEMDIADLRARIAQDDAREAARPAPVALTTNTRTIALPKLYRAATVV